MVQEYEEHHLKQESPDWSVVSRTAVLADAEGLLTCYGVGEDSTGQLTHAVIELCFTSSVRFLQPGLLLQVSCLSTSPHCLLAIALHMERIDLLVWSHMRVSRVGLQACSRGHARHKACSYSVNPILPSANAYGGSTLSGISDRGTASPAQSHMHFCLPQGLAADPPRF